MAEVPILYIATISLILLVIGRIYIARKKWVPWEHMGSGASIVCIGALLNTLAVLFNRHKMPVDCVGVEWCVRQVSTSSTNTLMDENTRLSFLVDIFRLPKDVLVSVGDITMLFGACITLIAGLANVWSYWKRKTRWFHSDPS